MEYTALQIAAILTFATGIIHSWLGERRLIGPLLSPHKRTGLLEKSWFSRQVLRFAWHLTTVAWWGLAAIMAGLSMTPLNDQSSMVLIIVAVTMLATGMATLFFTRGRHLAWPIFLTIAALCMLPVLQATS